jgi:acetylornithine/succinyldiaminopimelate/putrescine aminotransferase
VVLDRPAKGVAAALLARGVLAGTANDPMCLRLCPPAVLPEAALHDLEVALRAVLSES